jgi:hypothetical protein
MNDLLIDECAFLLSMVNDWVDSAQIASLDGGFEF